MYIYAIRSRKSGRYFKFEEYCDDGYGEYIDSISYPFEANDLPSFLSKREKRSFLSGELTLPTFKDHAIEDVEIVRFELRTQS